MAGRPVHFEIPSDDTARSRAFWGSLFGWQFQRFEGPFEYHMAQADEQTGVGIHPVEDDAPIPGRGRAHGLRVYFDVDDIKAGAARVRELGGEGGDASPVPGMGWFAICKDTEGNEFGIWQTDPNASMPGE